MKRNIRMTLDFSFQQISPLWDEPSRAEEDRGI